MTIRILLAPAAAGKTTYALNRALSASKTLQSETLILVPTVAQKYALRSRLAKAGGALGVEIETFSEISKNSLSTTSENYTTLSKPIRHQLLRYVVNRQPLVHYRSLVRKPGFAHELARIIDDLKAAKIWPRDFLSAIKKLGPVPRLNELGMIYQTYQDHLHDLKWADIPGWSWLAVEALENSADEINPKWSLLIVDGFDNFTEVQLAMLKILAKRAEETIVTLTDVSEGLEGDGGRPVFHRFQTTRDNLERKLDVKGEPLATEVSGLIPKSISRSPVLAHLERYLFADNPTRLEPGNAVALTAAPDRAAEVRAALRWLKERIIDDNIPPQETALLARTITPYEPFIRQTAAEFGLPVHLVGGQSLRSNPAIVAILNLLELFLPRTDRDLGPSLPRQGVVDAWRSPYFLWANTQILPDHIENGSINPTDADALDKLARSGRVIGGLEQWKELFHSLAVSRPVEETALDEKPPANTVKQLAEKFEGFLKLIQPPIGPRSYREFALWLDTLLGPDPEHSLDAHEPANTLLLRLVDPDRIEDEDIYQRDLQALRELKEIIRSMVWVEEAIDQDQQVSYSEFFNDLAGMIDATTFKTPQGKGGDKILVADVIAARGLTFRAAAVMGLAEGEFPKTYVEDPFLWETDRSQLSQTKGVLLDSSIESYEREYFYQTVTRAREKLMFTRPRLADSGAEWQPSPFWEEILRLVDVNPTLLTTESLPAPEKAASLPELIESVVIHPNHEDALDHIQGSDALRLTHLSESGQIFDQRYSKDRTPFTGDLTSWAKIFTKHFDKSHNWSPSSLESYHSCPWLFFVGRALKLEPRQEPAEGLDAAHLGSIYHEIFEQLYQALDPPQRMDPSKLLDILPSIARKVLDEAPAKQGFRETAWWRETRQEIADNIAHSIVALAEIQGDFVPVGFELRFFKSRTLTVHDGNDRFQLRGVIDRVDRDREGRSRIIDYKTAGPYNYTKKTLENGDKIQLALYALAARDALDLGEPVDGFYWHVRHAQPSDLTLSTYGPSEAIDVAVGHAWDSVRGARQGSFLARPPANGCPSYCPVAGFCWNYRPGMWS